MKYFIYLFLLSYIVSCKKEMTETIVEKKIEPKDTTVKVDIKDSVSIVQKLSSLDSASVTNKKTSWFITNKTFDEILEVKETPFYGFMERSWGFTPYIQTPITIADYWNDRGNLFYYDFNKDGKKDVWAWCYKSQFPTNMLGINVFSEYVKNDFTTFNSKIEKSLTSVRKAVVSDVDNDGYEDIVMFSQGYDAEPFPGDSIGIYYPKENKFQYLSEDIGFFHGGAVGDINNDGLVDIVSFGLPNMMNNTPTIYLNKGNRRFVKSTSNQVNFPPDGKGGYPSIELYDIDNDGFLDMILGSTNSIKIIKNTNGVFDMKNITNITTEALPLSFIFYDFDKNGKIDILSTNTYNYQGYNINLYLNDGKNFVDETKKYFDVTSHQSKFTWIKWLRIFDYDKDGDLDIVGDGTFGSLLYKKIHWKNNNGKYNQIIN
jgi:hypothetical protein